MEKKKSSLGAVIIVALLLTAGSANAETYVYICKVAGKAYPLRIDDTSNIIEWRGNKYRSTVVEGCKAIWHATPKHNDELRPFDVCAATHGYASIDHGDNVKIECQMPGRR